jgi:hypothetical protein
MTIRWVLAAVCLVVALPIAVFLRSADADPPPEVIVIKVCNKPVVIYTIDKGIGTLYIVEALVEHDEEMQKVVRYLQYGSVQIYRGEKWLGLNCPTQI